MPLHELRDLDVARQYIVQGLWLQRINRSTAAGLRAVLDWTLAIADGGQALPPVGFVADLGHILLASQREGPSHREPAGLPGLPGGFARTYEDIVLGKACSDRSVDRAADVIRRLQGRDRSRGVAFVVNQCRERLNLGGVMLSPAVIKSLHDAPADEVLSRGWDSLNSGIHPLLIELYEELIAGFRLAADLLAPEDVFELEHGTALMDLGQRVALRQVLQTANSFEKGLPNHKPRPLVDRREVATRIFDEDSYPVGGFASLSTRGSVESLLQSQLAYMEPDNVDRPDLFDVKFLRDELLYYSRDENQFLRRRRGFTIALLPDLTRTRFKDVDLPTQRIVLILAVLVVVVRKLTDWLSSDALTFEFLFVAAGDVQPLSHEESLLSLLLREPIANGSVQLTRVPSLAAAQARTAERSRRSLCHSLTVGATRVEPARESIESLQLLVTGARPQLLGPNGECEPSDAEPWDAWQRTLERLLELWI